MQKPSQEEPGLTYTDEGEIQWAAGIFEGEGSLSKKHHKTGDFYTFKVSMTDKDVLDKLADIFSLKVNGPYDPNKSPSTSKLKAASGSTNTRKEYFEVTVSARGKIFDIVCAIYPYLYARRREKCDEFLAWYAAKENMRFD